MSRPSDPRDPDALALAQALREQEGQMQAPDVREALQQRLQAETRSSGTGYLVMQLVLLGALVAMAVWYFWY